MSESGQRNSFKPPRVLLGLIEAAANRMMQYDADIRPRLDALNGRTVKVALLGVGIEFYVVIQDARMIFLEQCSQPEDVSIQGTPSAFTQLAVNGSSHNLPDGMRLSGDMKTAQQFQALIQALDIDWEEILAQSIGDVAARQVGLFADSAKRWFARTRETVQLSLTDYVQEEAQLSPSRIEVDNFSNDLSKLQMDVDRLEARLHRLNMN